MDDLVVVNRPIQEVFEFMTNQSNAKLWKIERKNNATGRKLKWSQVEETRMVFEGICIMTKNVSRLAKFYRQLFETTSEGNDEHTTINVGGLGVAIWKQDIPEGMNDEKMKEIRKHCYALMFSSPDVDKTYARARELGAAIQEVPADQPWGCRAFVMNDPDGNRIDIVGKL